MRGRLRSLRVVALPPSNEDSLLVSIKTRAWARTTSTTTPPHSWSMTAPEEPLLHTHSKSTHCLNTSTQFIPNRKTVIIAKPRLKLAEVTHGRTSQSKASKTMAITANRAAVAARVKSVPSTSRLWSTYWSNTWRKNFKVREAARVRRLKEPLIQESNTKSRCPSLRPLLK